MRTIRASVSGLAGRVADQADPVADHDRRAAQLAGPHRGDRRPGGPRPGRRCSGPGRRRSPRPVDGVVVLGPVLGARAGAAPPGRTRTSSRRTRAALSAAPRRDGSSRARSAVHSAGNSGMRLGGAGDVVDARRPAPRRPMTAAAWPSGGRRRSRHGAAVQRARAGSASPSAVSSTSPPSAVDLGGQRGQPVGLVAADVRDAAQPRRAGRPARPARRRSGSARRRRAGRRRAGELRPVPVTVRPSRRGSTVRPAARADRAGWSPACVVCGGQPATVTCPPVTRAAARNGAALDRSGSTASPGRRPARARPARCPARRRRPSTPRVAQHLHGHLDVRREGTGGAVVADVTPSSKPGAGEQQPGDELATTPRRRW